jgi:hypothetical protein
MKNRPKKVKMKISAKAPLVQQMPYKWPQSKNHKKIVKNKKIDDTFA